MFFFPRFPRRICKIHQRNSFYCSFFGLDPRVVISFSPEYPELPATFLFHPHSKSRNIEVVPPLLWIYNFFSATKAQTSIERNLDLSPTKVSVGNHSSTFKRGQLTSKLWLWMDDAQMDARTYRRTDTWRY